MWRELEGDHVVRHPQVRSRERLISQPVSECLNDGSLSICMSEGPRSEDGDNSVDANEVECMNNARFQYLTGLRNEHENGNVSGSEQSADFGELEKGRVRQIFWEWMNNGERSHTSNASHIKKHSSALGLGENECGRVKIVREWVQRTSQQRCINGGYIDQADVIGGPTERVRDGLMANCYENGTKKAMQRLYGRQTLLDLLTRAEKERKRELQGLLDYRPVSHFAHRNRIQSVLRGRFLRNNRLAQDKKHASVAANELGLLRERLTVSDLREEFLSRADNLFLGPVTKAQCDASPNNDTSDYGDNQSLAVNSHQPVNESFDQYEINNSERETNGFCEYNPESYKGRDVDREESAQMHETQDACSGNIEGEQQQASNTGCSGRTYDTGYELDGNSQGSTARESFEGDLGNEGSGQGHLVEPEDVFHEHYDPVDEENDVHMVSDYGNGLEGNTVEEFIWQDNSVQVVEWHEPVHWGSNWQQLAAAAESSKWENSTSEGEDGAWQESTSNQWHEDASQNDDREQSQLEESQEWNENGLQEVLDNWLSGPSSQGHVPVRTVDSFLFPDNDNESNSELRELLSRRRVSGLLQSGFRENLNQLIRSYIERQGNAAQDWEADSTSPSPQLVEQEHEMQNVYQHAGQSDATASNPLALPAPPATPSQSLWDRELNNVNWPCRNIHQNLGIEWEILNDLRIDMARLQQRMNNMQQLLETCMDMQFELLHSVRQEVSTALNTSAGSIDAYVGNLTKDKAELDSLRNGICCVFCDCRIDSLLYRYC